MLRDRKDAGFKSRKQYVQSKSGAEMGAWVRQEAAKEKEPTLMI